MNLAYLILATLFGLYSHYLVRWKQGRTASTFKEYMLQEWPSTIHSAGASLMGCIGTYAAMPDDIETKALLGIIYGAYMTAYTLDSVLNRDPNPSIPQTTSIPVRKYEENVTVTKEPTTEEINDILRADRDL